MKPYFIGEIYCNQPIQDGKLSIFLNNPLYIYRGKSVLRDKAIEVG